MKILVAEDNLQSRYLLEQFLASRGFEVWSATDGQAALALCRERGAPDAIVSDALMPGMDGFEFCYAIRNDPALRNTPFVLYTATYTEDDDQRFAQSVGVDRFVIKPVEMPELLHVIETLMREPRAPLESGRTQAVQPPTFFEEHSRLVSIKLEDKVADLSRANAALAESERAVRELNERLVASVRTLESEVEERRRMEQLLRQAQQAGGIGTWVLDTTDGVIRWSNEARTILGIEGLAARERLETFLERIDPGERERLRARLAAASHDASPLATEVTCTSRESGQPRHLFLCGEPSPSHEGTHAQWLGIVQDITERKQEETRRRVAAQQMFRSQKMEALGTLAGGIAHDFNNILAAILLNAEMAASELRSGATDVVLGALTEITEASNRSRQIIRQILTFSRGESTERVVAPLAGIVRSGIQLIRPALDKGIELKTDLGCEVHILANENQLHQVLLNLCTNAAHAMRDPGGVLSIRLSQEEITPATVAGRGPLMPGTYARLEVSDTGSGMPPEIIEHIFEPYFTTKDSSEGTGLGLAVVHGAVRAHHGAVFVESTPGSGTTFSLYFPAVPASAGSRADTRPGYMPDGNGELILVVDDEPSVARSAAQFAELLGYRAQAYTDPIEAREAFARGGSDYALAIVDFLMPRLTGVDFAKAIWAMRPGFPIILVAGFGGQMDATRARAEGFQCVLAKPFTKAGLAEAIARAIRAGANR